MPVFVFGILLMFSTFSLATAQKNERFSKHEMKFICAHLKKNNKIIRCNTDLNAPPKLFIVNCSTVDTVASDVFTIMVKGTWFNSLKKDSFFLTRNKTYLKNDMFAKSINSFIYESKKDTSKILINKGIFLGDTKEDIIRTIKKRVNWTEDYLYRFKNNQKYYQNDKYYWDRGYLSAYYYKNQLVKLKKESRSAETERTLHYYFIDGVLIYIFVEYMAKFNDLYYYRTYWDNNVIIKIESSDGYNDNIKERNLDFNHNVLIQHLINALEHL